MDHAGAQRDFILMLIDICVVDASLLLVVSVHLSHCALKGGRHEGNIMRSNSSGQEWTCLWFASSCYASVSTEYL